MIKNAMFHVENTENVLELAEYLSNAGWTIYTANKTEELLRNNKIPVVQEPSLVLNGPYMRDISGLVKRILTARVDESVQRSYIDTNSDNKIFLLCVNFYPSLDLELKPHQLKEYIKTENYYITSLLRNAFINYENVLLLTDPADYKEAIIQLKTDNITDEFRLYLAGKALNLIAAYDSGIASSILQNPLFDVKFMNYSTFPYKKQGDLKYGMNSQQKAAVFKYPIDQGIFCGVSKHYTEEMNYGILADVSKSWDIISGLYSNLKNQFNVKSTNCDGYDFTTQFTPLTGTVFTVAIKNKKILGAAVSTSVLESFHKTYTYDAENIDSVILGCSSVIDADAANEIVKCSFAALVAPGFTNEAKEILEKNKSIRLIITSKVQTSRFDGQLLNGGLIIQEKDTKLFDHWNVKTKNRPSQFKTDEMALGMLLAMETSSYSAIIISQNSIVGIAQGCVSVTQAIGSVMYEAKLNANRNNRKLDADVLICDAPIPFNDVTRELIESGITAIIQPGGTYADKDFIQFCDERGVVMVFTEMTHINY